LLPLGNCKVIEHVIRRCKNFGFRAIVCTTTAEADDILEHIADVEDVEIFRGNIDPQARWLDCAIWHDIYSFHAIDCDDPYFDPLEVERSYSYMNDLSLHCVMPTKSSSNYALGMMGTSLSRRKGETRILPEKDQPRRIRLTLDYEEDYWLLQSIARNGCDENSSRPTVEAVASYPMTSINHFRNEDWKANQCREIHSANTTETNSTTLLNS
jgi:spore coat polysaccharide biosynthesis protein SpsF (cytidylyltransferase family)